jgi:hypothetical protein
MYSSLPNCGTIHTLFVNHTDIFNLMEQFKNGEGDGPVMPRELDRRHIRILEELGKGAFGLVVKVCVCVCVCVCLCLCVVCVRVCVCVCVLCVVCCVVCVCVCVPLRQLMSEDLPVLPSLHTAFPFSSSFLFPLYRFLTYGRYHPHPLLLLQ